MDYPLVGNSELLLPIKIRVTLMNFMVSKICNV